MLDKASCRDWAAEVRANPAGFSAHKFGLQHTTPVEDPGRDQANRRLSTIELNQVRQGFENCREAIGWSHDIMVHCHWEFDLRTSILIAEAVAPMKPLFFEDALQVHYTDAWSRLTAMSPVAICTGENWMRRQEALPFVINHGCDILHPDLRNSGGFLETKRMADMADSLRSADGKPQHRWHREHDGHDSVGGLHPRLPGLRNRDVQGGLAGRCHTP